eukprot:2983845-Heterocapsa_arctica.AAC.1
MDAARHEHQQLPQVDPMGHIEEFLQRGQGVECEPDRRGVLGRHHGDSEQQAAVPQLHDQDHRQEQDADQGDPQRWTSRQEEA